MNIHTPQSSVQEPLSDLHVMLAQIERTFDATRLNEIVNNPSVYPWVKGEADGPLDLSAIVEHPANVLLMGEHGALLFAFRQLRLYEAHTQVLPEGRGPWAVSFVRACLHWMFTRTDAMEIITRCPHGNRPALALAKRINGVYEMTNDRGWWNPEGKLVPADIYALTIQRWMRTAPGLEERGAWFHRRIEEEYARHGVFEPPHPDDSTHDRYVGAACEMMLGDLPEKAMLLYNRFAAMSGYEPVNLIDYDPLTIDIRDAILIIGGEDFWMLSTSRSKD